MRIDVRSSGRLGTGALLLAALAVSGCATFRLYDQSKDTAAKDIKAGYGQVQLLTVVDTERKNLDALLQEELAVLREARRAGLDLDLLALVDSARPIGFAIASPLETHTLRVKNGEAKWVKAIDTGPLIKRANNLIGGAGGVAALGMAPLATTRYKLFAGRVRDRAELITEQTGGRKPPDCETDRLDEALDAFVKSIQNPATQGLVQTSAGVYQKACAELRSEVSAAGIAALRKATLAAARYESFAGRVRDRAESIAEQTGGRRPPACETDQLHEALDAFVKSIQDPTTQAMVKINADVYQKACAELRGEIGVGEIARAARAAEAARAVVKARKAESEQISTRLSQATVAYDAAVKAVKAADTSQTRERLRDAATGLKGALDGAAKGLAAQDIEILPEMQVQAIDRILSAVAGGQVNAAKLTEPDLARAAAVAGNVPSLAGTIETMVRRARAPGVSDLLIEKEHQLLLRDHALRRTAFAEQRAELHEARYRALILEANVIVEEHDALCTFMEKQAGTDKRVDCDSLRVDVKQPPDAPVATLHECTFGIGRTSAATQSDQRLAGAACPLATTWSKALDEATPEAKRQLYRAVSALVRRRAIAEVLLDEVDIRLIDLAHQEVLTADEYAVRAWNSLIATPINQLAAYYGTGIKPAELADLIVKAVGLAAIGIGVNR